MDGEDRGGEEGRAGEKLGANGEPYVESTRCIPNSERLVEDGADMTSIVFLAPESSNRSDAWGGERGIVNFCA
jgi:hypothetical protein